MRAIGLMFAMRILPLLVAAVCLVIQSRVRAANDVRSFGAIGDGKADDTAAIQKAVDSDAGTVQLTITRVNIRECRHAIHLTQRNRNLIVSDSHLYKNRGIGISTTR